MMDFPTNPWPFIAVVLIVLCQNCASKMTGLGVRWEVISTLADTRLQFES